MILYYNLDVNFESCTTIQAKIAKIDAIIDALLTTALKSVQKGDKVEYTLDSGATKTKVVYSSTESVTNALERYEKIRNMYVRRLTGGTIRNIDQRNLKRR
jgi:hypothetical protein